MAVPTIPSGESLLALLDVVYDTRDSDVVWLAEVAGAVAPATGATCGVHAYFVEATTRALRLQHPMLVGGPRSWQRHWRTDWWDPFMAAMDQATLRSVHGFGPCSFATDIWEAAQLQIPVLSEYLSAMASSRWGATHQRYLKPNRAPAGSSPIFPDSFNLFASDGEGSGCAVIVNLPEVRAARFTPAEAAFWGKLSSHVAAGLRLRRQRQRKGSAANSASGLTIRCSSPRVASCCSRLAPRGCASRSRPASTGSAGSFARPRRSTRPPRPEPCAWPRPSTRSEPSPTNSSGD